MSTIKTNTIQPTQAGNNLVFTNGTAVEKMRITDGGLVGIGTASPTVALHVIGEAAVDYSAADAPLGPAMRIGTNANISFIGNNHYYNGVNNFVRSRAGGSSTIQFWNTNDAVGSRIDFLVGGTGAKDSVIPNKNAMSILPDGSLQIGEDGNAIAVAQPITITRHHLFAQGSGSVVSGYTGQQTVVGDTWLIGEFLLGAAGDNCPMHCEMIVSSQVANSIDTTTYNFGAHYNAFDIGAGGWTPWCILPVTHCTRYNLGSDIQSFRFDVRKKYGGNVQIRMRCTNAGIMYTNNQPINITFRTVAPSSVKFVPAAVGSAGNSVVATPVNMGTDLVAAPAGGYAGRHMYEFPVGDQFRPTPNGMFVDTAGGVQIYNNLNSNKVTIGGYGSGLGYGIRFNAYADTSGPCIFHNAAGTAVGAINTVGSSTSYATTSDYRLKTNVLALTDALGTVSKINPVSFTWKSDNKTDIGFIAHELAAVVPQATVGEKDAVNDDGTIKPQQMDAGKIIPLLTAAIQELKAIVEAQAARIAALEGN